MWVSKCVCASNGDKRMRRNLAASAAEQRTPLNQARAPPTLAVPVGSWLAAGLLNTQCCVLRRAEMHRTATCLCCQPAPARSHACFSPHCWHTDWGARSFPFLIAQTTPMAASLTRAVLAAAVHPLAVFLKAH